MDTGIFYQFHFIGITSVWQRKFCFYLMLTIAHAYFPICARLHPPGFSNPNVFLLSVLAEKFPCTPEWFMEPFTICPPLHKGKAWEVDCYTVLAWWQQDCHWGMKHGPQSSGINLLWSVGLYIGWDCLVSRCIVGSPDQWEFSPFQPPLTVRLPSPNCKLRPAIRSVQRDCERVTCKVMRVQNTYIITMFGWFKFAALVLFCEYSGLATHLHRKPSTSNKYIRLIVWRVYAWAYRLVQTKINFNIYELRYIRFSPNHKYILTFNLRSVSQIWFIWTIIYLNKLCKKAIHIMYRFIASTKEIINLIW